MRPLTRARRNGGGSLRDAASIAGIVQAAGGRRYVVVAIVNHPGANAARPALEALVSEGADARQLPRLIGLYNVVWAATAALACNGGCAPPAPPTRPTPPSTSSCGCETGGGGGASALGGVRPGGGGGVSA